MAHILLVEDDDAFRETLLALLESLGHTVTSSVDGTEGMRIIRSGAAFDLIITDIFMPQKDGIEFIIELRSIDRAIPVVAISGGPRQISIGSLLSTASQLGANDVLSKPFTRDALDATLNKALARNQEPEPRLMEARP